MELLHWQKTAKVDYAATTYWYAMEGAANNGELPPKDVRVKIGDLTGWGDVDKAKDE